METLYIVIGAFSSIFIFLLGYAVSGVFNGKKKMNDLESFDLHIDKRISDLERELNEKIDRSGDILARNIGELDKDIHSQLDSRLDKLLTKMKGLIPPTNEELIERIKKMEEESYRLRMNL